MPLRFAIEPQDGSELVRAGLNRLAARRSHVSMRAVDFSAVQLKPPHAIYDLRADEIANGAGLASAHATGFRYLVEAPSGTVAAAEVHADASGRATLLANVNYGPFVAATARALDQLAKLNQVRAGSYEVRLLRFSAILLMAIWLKSDTGDPDIIYPLAPAPDVLQADKPCSADDFLKAIMPVAKARAAKKASPAVP
jgi:hypothetical protein